jgi:hypothetical protein
MDEVAGPALRRCLQLLPQRARWPSCVTWLAVGHGRVPSQARTRQMVCACVATPHGARCRGARAHRRRSREAAHTPLSDRAARRQVRAGSRPAAPARGGPTLAVGTAVENAGGARTGGKSTISLGFDPAPVQTAAMTRRDPNASSLGAARAYRAQPARRPGLTSQRPWHVFSSGRSRIPHVREVQRTAPGCVCAAVQEHRGRAALT